MPTHASRTPVTTTIPRAIKITQKRRISFRNRIERDRPRFLAPVCCLVALLCSQQVIADGQGTVLVFPGVDAVALPNQDAASTEDDFDTVVAHNGDDALSAIPREHIDLVLMDCHMPVRDGYDTTEEIRRRESRSGHADRIPVVAVTADFLESNRKKCLDCGMDDYVTKPFTQEHMRIVLARWLNDAANDNSAPAIAVDSDGFSDLGETTTLASINREVLEELRGLDSSAGSNIVREIIVSYCATSTKMMLQLRSAVAEGDCRNIELIAHSLKGSSGQVGATLLASLCEHLIFGAKRNDLGDSMPVFERVAIEHAAVIAGLDKELQRMVA